MNVRPESEHASRVLYVAHAARVCFRKATLADGLKTTLGVFYDTIIFRRLM